MFVEGDFNDRDLAHHRDAYQTKDRVLFYKMVAVAKLRNEAVFSYSAFSMRGRSRICSYSVARLCTELDV
jgi:hypothetical protein